MSRFLIEQFQTLEPYVPGEQPKEGIFTKLNTNESPFAPDQSYLEYAFKNYRKFNLYSDPEGRELRDAIAKQYGLTRDNVVISNGSDEVLNYIFMAYCDGKTQAAFADITYGFYKVFSDINDIEYEEIPLKDDYSFDVERFLGIGKTIFIANPNAPTGMYLSLGEIERILKSNPDNIVVVDEAYIDFGGESSVTLLKDYDNLIVVRTFSKSFSMAGARLGFAMASKDIIADLNAIRYSTNPYNVNSMTLALGEAMMRNPDIVFSNCKVIMENRQYAIDELSKRGFTTLPSKANFIFTKHESYSGYQLYQKLKEEYVLVRHFETPRLKDYNRITIGSKEQIDILLETLDSILK